jgi:hypothetical protein
MENREAFVVSAARFSSGTDALRNAHLRAIAFRGIHRALFLCRRCVEIAMEKYRVNAWERAARNEK